MNHHKINAILSDYNDCSDLLRYFTKKKDEQNCKNLSRYRLILDDDLNMLIGDSNHRPGSQQTDSEAHKAIDLDAVKSAAVVGI